MTNILRRVLRALHLAPQRFDEDDMINAQIEDKQRDYTNLVNKLGETLTKRRELNTSLRESIRIARESTKSFEDFELLTIRRKDQRHD
jgi:translation initiation factor 2B subunit (eIF-2B alpha/beta/delta family)